MANGHAIGRTLPGLILNYLLQTGAECSNEAIRLGVGHDSRDCINTTLCRMHRLGWIERTRMGHYKLTYASKDMPDMQLEIDCVIVAATLEYLKTNYPRALRQELHKRGWSQ